MKMPAPNGSNDSTCKFNKISESFGKETEFSQLKISNDHDVLPEATRSIPDQSFDSAKDRRQVQVHPIDPKRISFVASNLGPA